MLELKERFEAWLSEVNALLNIKNFAIHIELRYDGKHICPIEFNPARFAGLGGHRGLAVWLWLYQL